MYLLPSAKFSFGPFCQQKSETFHGIQIHGSAEFLSRTREALELLRPTAFFAEIQRCIAIIKEGKRSGMKAYAKRPTFIVGKPTWSHSPIWYAGAIAHDCHHSKLYHQAKERTGEKPAADNWTGSDAEKKCLAFQLRVLQELKADENMIAYVRGCAENPTYQGRCKGWRAWWDYLHRWW